MIGAAVVFIIVGLALGGAAIVADVNRQHRLAAFLQGEDPRRQQRTNQALFPNLLRDTSIVFAVGATVAVVVASALLWRDVAVTLILGSVAAAIAFGVRAKIRRKRTEALRTQFADGIASLASSMSAGSTFLRSLQELERNSPEPLQPQLEQVLNEVDLGEQVSVAIASMARRTGLREASWLAHILRIQELTGSPIAGLLQELSGLVRQTDSLHREIRALTAEGRISAYVIAGLPLALVAILSVSHPGYLDPFTRGWGLFVTAGMIGAIAAGLVVMNLMVRTVEV